MYLLVNVTSCGFSGVGRRKLAILVGHIVVLHDVRNCQALFNIFNFRREILRLHPGVFRAGKLCFDVPASCLVEVLGLLLNDADVVVVFLFDVVGLPF